MGTITVGPALDLEQKTVPIQRYPFAYRLSYELRDRGISVAFDGMLDGAKIGQSSAEGYVQLHAAEDCPYDMATAIEQRCGKFVVFRNLWVPANGVSYAGTERCENVWVRHIMHYYCPTDEMLQRWDVLVRPGMVTS